MNTQTAHFRPARVLIDQAAMRHNLNRVRDFCPQAQIMAVVKADAYGHGMEAAVDALQQADVFAVSGLDDVLRLREHGVDKPICVLSANYGKAQLQKMAEHGVQVVVFDHSQLQMLQRVPNNEALDVWIKVDTGMGRLGFLPQDLPDVLQQVRQTPAVHKTMLMTHLANGDVPHHPANLQQIQLFESLALQADYDALSILNSAGVTAFADHAHDVVRPGIMLYGISPEAGVTGQKFELRPAMTFKSELISIKRLPAGSKIGYGSTFVLERDSRIGIVGCGYGDGYPRHAPNGTPVRINGIIVPLIGRVSMDMLTVDLDELPARVGDEVILWGADNPIEEVAMAAGTIAYELSCGISPRVQRIIV